MSLELAERDSDWIVLENAKYRRDRTYIPATEPSDALKVTRNTGTLGSGGEAVSVNAGTCVVNGTTYNIGSQTVDIPLGEQQPRRDVVYISESGTVEVAVGTPHEPKWGEGVAQLFQSLETAYLPSPKALDNGGLPLAIVTVSGGGATALGTDSWVVEDIRVPESEFGAGIDDAFKNNEFGYRRLSSFDTLQGAVDWTGGGSPKGIFVDGKFETDETGVTIPDGGTSFVGFGAMPMNAKPFATPSIVSTSSSSDPFTIYENGNVNFRLHGVAFYNNGAPKPFFYPGPNFDGFLNENTTWTDVGVVKFGGTSANPYALYLKNGFAVSMSNVTLFHDGAPSLGSVKMEGTHGSEFDSLSIMQPDIPDDETPCLYAKNCEGLLFNSLRVEGFRTDAAVQLEGATAQFNTPYIEAHARANNNWRANTAIQIGSGGNGSGKAGVAGTDQKATATIVEPNLHSLDVDKSQIEHLRVLNSEHTQLIGREFSEKTKINYGGSNAHAQSQLTVAPGPLKIIGETGAEITNSTNGPASIDIDNGRVFESVANAESGLQPYEHGWIIDSQGWAIARADGTGSVTVWRPGGGGGGPTTDLRWSLLDSATDSGQISTTLTTGGAFDRLRLVGSFGAGNPVPDVTVRTSGTGANYSYTVRDAGSFTHQTGQTEWLLIPANSSGGRQYSFEATVTGADAGAGAAVPAIAADVAGTGGLVAGECFNTSLPVSELTVEASKGTLTAELYGRNF